MERLLPWNRWPRHLQVLFILMTAAVVGWLRFHGISLEGDPAAYAKLAYLDAQGLPPWAEWTFTSRLGLIAPTSLVLSITGPQVWAFVLWPWTCLVILSLVIWWRFEGRLQIILLGVLLLSPWPAAYGVQLFPDFPMLTFSMLALLLLPHLRSDYIGHTEWIWGIAFTASLVIAGLCKLTMLYLLPGLVGLALYDIFQRQHGVFWGVAVAMGISLLGLSFLHEDWNFLQRINHLEADHNSSLFSFSWDQPEALLSRLIQDPFWEFFGNPGVSILLFPALAGIFSDHRFAKPASILLGYLLVVHWVGTTSLHKYSPIPADPRMWILLSGPLILLAGIGLDSLHHQINTREKWGWAVIMALCCWVGVISLPRVAFPLLAGIVFFPLSRCRPWAARGFGLILCLWMGYHFYNRDNQYYQARELRLLQDSLPQGAVVYVDSVLAFSGYLYEANGVKPMSTWPDALPVQDSVTPQFFLWNEIRVNNSNLYEPRISIPAYIEDIRSTWEVLGDTAYPALRLYHLPTSDL